MGKPAARLGDMHVCPMVTGTVPHVGGPIVGPGCPTILIGGMPAAVMTDTCVCAGPPDTVVKGSTGVFFGGKPAARMGDKCAHGGAIVIGCPTVLIGDKSGGMPLKVLLDMVKVIPLLAQKAALKQAADNGAPFCEKCNEAMMKAQEENALASEEDMSMYEKAKEAFQKVKEVFFKEKDPNEDFLEDNFVAAVKITIAAGPLPSQFPNLTIDELTAIKVYTSDNKRNGKLIYKTLNTELREDNLSSYNKGLNNLLCSGLDKLDPHKSTVNRGVYGGEAEFANSWKVGDTVKFQDFKSCSTSFSIAALGFGVNNESNDSNVIYVIEGAEGNKVSEISCSPHEDEVLLKPNSQFKVKKIDPDYIVYDQNYETVGSFKKITLVQVP